MQVYSWKYWNIYIENIENMNIEKNMKYWKYFIVELGAKYGTNVGER